MPSKSDRSLTIVYVTNTRFPTEKAHGLATVKICEAFADLGVNVEIVAPRVWRSSGDPYDFYGVRRNFNITRLPVIDLLPLGVFEPFFFMLQIATFSIVAFFYCLMKYGSRRDHVVYFSHDYIPLVALSLVSPRVYYDIHHYPGKNHLYKTLMRRSFGFAVQTRWKINELVADFSIDPKKIVYWPNGTDVARFVQAPNKSASRQQLGLDPSRPIALYTGQLFDWKGVDTLIRASSGLPDVDIYLVGGSARDVAALKEALPEALNANIHFIGFRPHAEIPVWLHAADLVVLPNTATQKVSLYYTSPMKLFEYMASGTPIIASKIPSVEELVSESSALLVTADDSVALALGIRAVLSDPNVASRRAAKAQSDARMYTWVARGDKILDHMRSLLSNKSL